MTVTLISETRAIVNGDAYAIRVGGNWLWDKGGRLVGRSVLVAIEAELERQRVHQHDRR